MRITFVTPYYYPEQKFGGPPGKIRSVARGLIQRGVEVTVLTFDSTHSANNARRCVDGVSVQYLSWVGRGLRQWPREASILSEAINLSNITHCYGLYNAIVPVAARSCRRYRKPLILEPLGMYPPRERNRAFKRLYNWTVTRRLVRQSKAVIAASQGEIDDLKQIVPLNKLVMRANGIDVAAFANLPAGDVLRQRWGLGIDERVVLFVGRLSPIKNIEQLIIAFADAGVPNARLILVGPLSEEGYVRRLRSLLVEKNLEKSVTVAGALYEEEQKAALGLADLFVLPSLNESFGNAAAEAVAANVPVLLTSTCGIAPLINGRAGLAVPLGVDALAEGLRQMLKSEVRDQMTARREEVKRELSWDEPIRQTIELYHRVIRENAERLKN